MTPATAEHHLEAIPYAQLPEWARAVLAIGGRKNPWVTVAQALPYLPCRDRKSAYPPCNRYNRRVTRERKRRGTYLISVDALDARADEIPCVRFGRTVMLPKRLLVERLLGCRVSWPRGAS